MPPQQVSRGWGRGGAAGVRRISSPAGSKSSKHLRGAFSALHSMLNPAAGGEGHDHNVVDFCSNPSKRRVRCPPLYQTERKIAHTRGESPSMAEGAQILSNLGTISYMHAAFNDSGAEGRKPNVARHTTPIRGLFRPLFQPRRLLGCFKAVSSV